MPSSLAAAANLPAHLRKNLENGFGGGGGFAVPSVDVGLLPLKGLIPAFADDLPAGAFDQLVIELPRLVIAFVSGIADAEI